MIINNNSAFEVANPMHTTPVKGNNSPVTTASIGSSRSSSPALEESPISKIMRNMVANQNEKTRERARLTLDVPYPTTSFI